ncbi:MAG: HDOD domain-containing protein [Puniceicoccaceae bacterium]|nr:MAG: HDOD domain-containing protein [Puniceicoccaceae bacterium]
MTMHPEIESLVRNSSRVPTLPTVYFRIRDAIDNPRASFENIAEITSSDQGLTARLLRLANSAFYGYPSSISSISEALTVIGLQQFRDLALSTCIIDLFRGIPSDLIEMRSFWQHCVATGLCARLLAQERRESNSERFFLGGLLHDIGRLILYQARPEESLEILREAKANHRLQFLVERERLGFDHADLGGALLEQWHLPKSLIEVVRRHHDPLQTATNPGETSIVHVADFLAHSLQLGTTGEQFVPPLCAEAWESCGASRPTLPFLVEQVERQYHDVTHIFIGGNN